MWYNVYGFYIETWLCYTDICQVWYNYYVPDAITTHWKAKSEGRWHHDFARRSQGVCFSCNVFCNFIWGHKDTVKENRDWNICQILIFLNILFPQKMSLVMILIAVDLGQRWISAYARRSFLCDDVWICLAYFENYYL